MRFVIVTGMSGAGKSTALKIFEDLGYYCADNLPPSLIADFATLCLKHDTGITNIAIGIDIRGGKLFNDLFAGLEKLENLDILFDILFLESEDEVLITRYKETRHNHPLSKQGLISEGLSQERKLLEAIKERATLIIDTSYILPRHLKEKLLEIFVDGEHFDGLMINITSFGFKYGLPSESDLVFDVRFIPNPFYVPSLKPLSGLDDAVKEFVLVNTVSARFLKSLESMLHFLIPHYTSEGKSHLVISIGCTGGRHRSVALAEALFETLNKSQYSVFVSHRDIDKDAVRMKK